MIRQLAEDSKPRVLKAHSGRTGGAVRFSSPAHFLRGFFMKSERIGRFASFSRISLICSSVSCEIFATFSEIEWSFFAMHIKWYAAIPKDIPSAIIARDTITLKRICEIISAFSIRSSIPLPSFNPLRNVMDSSWGIKSFLKPPFGYSSPLLGCLDA